MKKKKNILTKIGIQEPDYYPVEFLVFFEEQYIYFVRNVAIDKNNKNLRRVGNHYSFFQVGNISMEEDIDNKTIVRFEMINTKSKNEYFSKEFSIDTALIQKFTEILNLYFKLLGLETTSQSSHQ